MFLFTHPCWDSGTFLLQCCPHCAPQNKGTDPAAVLPWVSHHPQGRPDRPEPFAGPAQRICLQPLPSVCQRGNPPSRPFCLSPAFFSCPRIVWVGGSGPCPLPHPACLPLDAVISGPNPALPHWLLKALDAPRAPHLCLAGNRLSPCLQWAGLPSPGEPGQVGWA